MLWIRDILADSCLRPMDLDSDPAPYSAILVLDIQDAITKKFSAYYFLKVHIRIRNILADSCLRPMDPVRIRLRILLFSSLTFKTPTKKFFAFYFLKVHIRIQRMRIHNTGFYIHSSMKIRVRQHIHAANKDQLYGYFDIGECGHSTNCTAANKGPNKWLP